MKHVPSAITQILITAVFATGCSADLADSESAEEKVGQATQFETEGQPNFAYVDVDGDSQYDAGVDHELTKSDETTAYSVVVPAMDEVFVLSEWSFDVGGSITIASRTRCKRSTVAAAPRSPQHQNNEACAMKAAGDIHVSSFEGTAGLPVRFEAGGDLSLSNAEFHSNLLGKTRFAPRGGSIELTSGGNMTLANARMAVALRRSSSITLTAGGDLDISEARLTAHGREGASISISADGNVDAQRAFIQSSARFNKPANVLIDAGGNVDAQRAGLKAIGETKTSNVTVNAGGTDLSFESVRLQPGAAFLVDTCAGTPEGCGGDAVDIELRGLSRGLRRLNLCVDRSSVRALDNDVNYNIHATEKIKQHKCRLGAITIDAD